MSFWFKKRESQELKDINARILNPDINLINKLGKFLCEQSPCPYHKEQARIIINMVRNFDKGKNENNS